MVVGLMCLGDWAPRIRHASPAWAGGRLAGGVLREPQLHQLRDHIPVPLPRVRSLRHGIRDSWNSQVLPPPHPPHPFAQAPPLGHVTTPSASSVLAQWEKTKRKISKCDMWPPQAPPWVLAPTGCSGMGGGSRSNNVCFPNLRDHSLSYVFVSLLMNYIFLNNPPVLTGLDARPCFKTYPHFTQPFHSRLSSRAQTYDRHLIFSDRSAMKS